MLNRLFPATLGNDYRGYRLAIWFLAAVVLLKLTIGANSMINTRLVAETADAIPVSSYDAGGAGAVVSLFALLGLCNLLLGLQGAVVLIRYRAAIPLMYLILLIDYLGRRMLVALHPIARAGAATVGPFSIGALVNYTLLVMLLVGFALSLLDRARLPADAPR